MEYIADVGVSPSARGQGIGTAFLENGLNRARQYARKLYALDVAENNPRAAALYQRFGFRHTGTRRFSGPERGIAVPAAHRMEMTL